VIARVLLEGLIAGLIFGLDLNGSLLSLTGLPLFFLSAS
jgi:hypothetical protein